MTAGGVIVAGNRKIEDLWMLRVCAFQHRRPACIGPDRILFVLLPFLQVVTAGDSNSTTLVESIPSPIAISVVLKFQNRHGMGKLVSLPGLGFGHDVPRLAELQIGNGAGLIRSSRGL